MRLSDQVAVITGGVNGIGAEAALRMLAAAAEAGHGERIRFAKTDVSEGALMRAMFGATLARYGRLRCVFHNAGVVVFLASVDASFITGETIIVDGGQLEPAHPVWRRREQRTAGHCGPGQGPHGPGVRTKPEAGHTNLFTWPRTRTPAGGIFWQQN